MSSEDYRSSTFDNFFEGRSIIFSGELRQRCRKHIGRVRSI
ncbi:hypothetical protein M6B38_162935 [Iris pallida]|uniref:Uncharacterized protein n=1 Tax=Iris pallida TaxID=29817 RepID=A0AAX6EZX8_IRIPA|nr:hypothetical protein M6B38_162935 [Iris pallida]